MSDYLFDKQGEDTEVAALERALAGYRHRAPLRPPPARRRSRRIGTVVAVVAMAAGVALWWRGSERDDAPAIAELAPGADAPGANAPEAGAPPGTEVPARACEAGVRGFSFATEGGAASCAGGAAQVGVLPVGEWLETAARVSAAVEVADIGTLQVHEHSRLRLVATGPDQHRLELARGKVSAVVSAPPRLFVVDTPAASAVDLGCAYELAVDENRRTHLRVTLGAVSLEEHERLAWVPAGSEVSAEPGRGPGTPVAVSAPAPLRDAIARFDAGDPAALDDLLALAGEADTGTLWNLMLRTDGDARTRVFAQLQRLHPHPSHVRAQDLLAGDRAALDSWRDDLESATLE